LIFVAFVIAALAGCGGRPTATPAPIGAATAAPTLAPTPVPPSPTPAPPTATQPAPTATPAPPTPTVAPTATEPPTPEPTATAELPEATSVAGDAADQLPVPVPTDAADIEHDADTGDISFSSPSDVQTLVKFYRQEMAALGWQEDESGALVTDALGSLDFTRGDAAASLMILNVGDNSLVSISTLGLEMVAATPEATEQAPTEALTAEDDDGLPLPSDHTQYMGESGAYRRSLTTVSPSALKDVLALYRTELAARQWNELPATVAPTDAEATLLYDNLDNGQLELKLKANADGGTDISMVVRSEAAAKKDGILPPAGKARIYLGNMSDAAVTFHLDGKDIEVAVDSQGQPASMADVPSVDVAPGKHEFTLTLSGQPPITDTIEVAAGETWALVAGPDGALPLQMY